MEIYVDARVVTIVWAIVLNMVGFWALLHVTFGEIGSTLVILTVVDSAVILWRKLDKVQKLLEKDGQE